MNDAIEGRWWLDFTTQPARDPSGNEFVLAGGIVSIAQTGQPTGTYQIEPGWLELTLPMPSISGEGPWRMEVKLLLVDPMNPPERLLGMIQATDSSGAVIFNQTCSFVRRTAQA